MDPIPGDAPNTASYRLILPSPRSWRISKQQRVELAVRDAVTSGLLRPGMRLPPVRVSALMASVSVNTVLNAYHALADEGVLAVRHGVGFFILAGPRYCDFFVPRALSPISA